MEHSAAGQASFAVYSSPQDASPPGDQTEIAAFIDPFS